MPGLGTPGRFHAYAMPSPCRTWAEEMGGSSCGPRAHLVHLWPPHFAFSGHHPWDLGAHSGPALVRIWWGELGEMEGVEEATCFLLGSFSVSVSISGCLLFICRFSVSFVWSVFLPLLPFSGSLSLCVCPGPLHPCRGFRREEDVTSLLALPPLVLVFSLSLSVSPSLFLPPPPLSPSPFLLPPRKNGVLKGLHPEASLNPLLIFFSVAAHFCVAVSIVLIPYPPPLIFCLGRWGRICSWNLGAAEARSRAPLHPAQHASCLCPAPATPWP